MPFTIIDQGSFTSDGTDQKILLPSSADFFVTRNLTQMDTTQTPGRCVMGEWVGGSLFGDNDGIRYTKSDGSNVLEVDHFSTATASNGFTYVTQVPRVEAAVTVTAITAADPAVVSAANSYQEGDRVRLYGTTGMQQIAGMDFTISTVTATDFELLGLDASGFAAAATAGFARRISDLGLVEPRSLFVTGVTQAAQAVVSLSVAHDYVVGQQVHFSIPSSFGMTELDGLTGEITAVGTYTVTVDIDSSAFTAFAFPASSATPTTALFAMMSPAGQKTEHNPTTNVDTGYNVNYAPFHSGEFVPYMLVAAGAQSPAGSSNDVISWQAMKKEV